MLYPALVACAAAAAWIVYRYDLYEREPWYMLLLAAGVGFGVMALMSVVEPWTLSLYGPEPRPDDVVAAVAATHEEMARLLIVAALAVVLPRQLNDPMDGLIYGSIVGLGMAIEESLFYLDLDPAVGDVLPPTEIVRLCGHLVMGGITCFAIGMARFRMRGWAPALAGCVLLSMTLHFIWDHIAFNAGSKGVMSRGQTAAAVTVMIGGMLVYGRLTVTASRWSRAMFEPGSRRRLWGWPFGGSHA